MGEVYRATDTKLGREVAIKVLPEEFTADAERLARFEREARVLASLSHGSIAGIFEVGEQDDTHFLVMELAEGETLAERLERGPISIEEATKIAVQITEGLEAAHGQGIIHRDLKPANVKVDSEGNARILDFGLAKAWSSDGGSSADIAASPTLTANMTQAGVLLGTAAYMSPEQARGQEVDQRTDIWALGVLLWEMLTGSRLFTGTTVSDTLAAVLQGDLEAGSLPKNTPVQVREVLRRTLERDRSQRLHSVADARILLQESLAAPDLPAESTEAPGGKTGLSLAWVVPALLVALVAGWLATRALQPKSGPSQVIRSTLSLPEGQILRQGWGANLDLTPDGRLLAFATASPEGGRIYLRDLSTYESVVVDGSENGERPFFSPDGEWLAFFAGGQLKKVNTRGGASLPICDAPSTIGGTWLESGVIVFSDGDSLLRVDPGGGSPQVLASSDRPAGESGLLRPASLPGGKAVAFVIDRGAGTDADEVAAITLDGQRRVSLAKGAGGQPRSLPGNRLVVGRSTGLLVLGFDPETLEVTSEPVWALPGANEYQYAVAGNGTLVYQTTSQREPSHLMLVDRAGRTEQLTREPRGMRHPRVSPDGSRILVTIQEDEADLWLLDRTRSTLTRLTEDEGEAGVWSPDGEEIVYTTYLRDLRRRKADGSDAPRSLYEEVVSASAARSRASLVGPDSITPDGKAVFLTVPSPETLMDIWRFPLDGSEPSSVVKTEANETPGVISPNGKWLAYVSDTTGRLEVYVQDLEAFGARVQVSVEGGRAPVWSRDGTELFYRLGDAMYGVPVIAGARFQPGTPELLFEGSFFNLDTPQANYDVTPDGDFILIAHQRAGTSSLRMVQGWVWQLSGGE